MWRRTAFVALWVVATLVATSVAVAAVRGVTGRVVDAPTPTLATAADTQDVVVNAFGDPVSTVDGGDSGESGSNGATSGGSDTNSTSTSDADSGETSTTGVTTTEGGTTAEGVTTTTVTTTSEDPTSTTEDPGSGSTTTTTTSTTTTTTTTEAPAESRTYQLIGGWVRIETTPGNVTLVGAGPSAGFDMDVDETGPEEVEVEFESDDHESKFKAKWVGGDLVVDIQEIPDEDDNDDEDGG